MTQDTTLNLADWTQIANAAGLSGPDAWNLYSYHINTQSRLAALETVTPAGLPFISVKAAPYFATGDGVTDDSTAIRNALAALAAAGGGTLFFPAGTYLVNKQGSSPWCIALNSNFITVLGVPDLSVIKMKAGQPAGSVVTLYADFTTNLKLRDIIVDGNWGAVVGVTTDKTDGINHGDNTDPDSHGLMARGTQGLSIENCKFRQCYGDGVWLGTSTSSYATPARNIRITKTDFDIMGRSGIALGQKTDGVFMQACRFTNIMATPFDTEPSIGGRAVYCRDITIDSCEVNAGFWNPEDPARSVNCATSIVGASAFSHPFSNLRKYRFTNNKVRGQLLLAACEDVIVGGNEIVCDWPGYSYAPILCWWYADQIQIVGNTIYDRTTPATGDRHEAAIQVQYSANGNANWAPRNVVVAKNFIRARNGRAGIRVMGTGGGAYGTTGTLSQAGETGTATAVDNTYPPDSTGIAGETLFSNGGSSTTVSKATSTWSTNQWVGWMVRSNVDASVGEVTSNNGNTLTFTGGWKDLDGNPAPDPSFANKSFSLLPTLTDTGKAWTANTWAGRQILMGGKLASIMGNLATKLILDKNAGWTTPFGGEQVATPTAGTYRILPISGMVTVDDNDIDCTDDGHGAGGNGIQLHAYRAGMRVKCTRNKIRNATGAAIAVASASNRPFIHLEVTDNHAWDDQATPTCTSVVLFDALSAATKRILRNNQAGTGVTTVYSGLSSGYWLIQDGDTQEWAGFGTPEGNVTAPIGSTYCNKSGGASTTLYVKTSGTGNTGWTAK